MIKFGEVLNDQITNSNSHLCAERYTISRINDNFQDWIHWMVTGLERNRENANKILLMY